jgi:hypothetical protein
MSAAIYAIIKCDTVDFLGTWLGPKKKRTGLAGTPASDSPTIHVLTPILCLVDEQAQ